MIAFMKYDLFPYVLWGEVLEEGRSEGIVNVKSYGRYSIEAVKFILPHERGLKLAKDIQEIDNEYREAKEALHKKYVNKLNDLMAWKEK